MSSQEHENRGLGCSSGQRKPLMPVQDRVSPVSIGFHPALLERVNRAAAAENRSRSSLVIEAVRLWINRFEQRERARMDGGRS